MTTIKVETDPLAAVFFAVAGGKFRLKSAEDGFVKVLDDDGNIIGSAYRIYPDGYAVETAPYAGYVADSQIEWVD